MAKPRPIRVRLALTNPKCVKALHVMCDALADAAEDMPWRDDLRRGRKACKYLITHLTLVPEHRDYDEARLLIDDPPRGPC